MTSDNYTPRKEDRFSFGLWTVANRGRDPFGDFVRPELLPVHSVKKLSELGAWGISLHDNDLVPESLPPAMGRAASAICREAQPWALNRVRRQTSRAEHSRPMVLEYAKKLHRRDAT